MLESIEKLREWRNVPDNGYWADEIIEHADAIEHEVSERYMLLPVDADGVPICVGDVVAAQDEQPFEVRAFRFDALGWFAVERLGSQWNVNQLHHVKSRTVEDVLREFANSGTPTGDGGVLFETALIEKYADKLRDMLSGDAE